MAAFISRAFELEKSANVNFKDVKKGTDLYDSVSKLYAAGITTGYDDNTFRPDTKISQVHVAVFLARALGYDSEKPSGEEVKFHVLDGDEQSYVLETGKGNFVLFNPGNDYAKLKDNLKKQNINKLDIVYITNPSTMGALDELAKDKEFKGLTGFTVVADKSVELQTILKENPGISYFEYRPGYFGVDNDSTSIYGFIQQQKVNCQS